MWTRGKDKDNAGKFAIEVFNDAGQCVLSQGGFATAQEADRAAEIEQRNVLFGYSQGEGFACDLSDDELLKKLLA